MRGCASSEFMNLLGGLIGVYCRLAWYHLPVLVADIFEWPLGIKLGFVKILAHLLCSKSRSSILLYGFQIALKFLDSNNRQYFHHSVFHSLAIKMHIWR
jgi:hypothetical protein